MNQNDNERINAPIVLSSDSEEEMPKGVLEELEEDYEPAKRRKIEKIDTNVITIESSEEEETDPESEDSDIVESKDLFIDGNKVGQRWAPPKKELKPRRAKKAEQRNVLIRDFRLRNMAMPNRNLKSETRHPIPVVIDRSVAEFFYKRDLGGISLRMRLRRWLLDDEMSMQEANCHSKQFEKEARKFDEKYWKNADAQNVIGYDPETGLLTESTLYPNSTTNILPTPSIYECNKSCKCHDRKVVYCYNSMTSKVNCRYKTEIFLTTDKGWGYRAAEDIPAGAYITEYTGVVQPHSTHFDPEDPSKKIQMNKDNAVEMLDHFFRESLSLVEEKHNDGSKGELNKFDKEIARCTLKDNGKSVRNYEFTVDPVLDIIERFREKKKKSPLDWLATKHEGESPWNVEDKYEEERIKIDGKNSTELMKLYAYDQAYYGGFSMDASGYGNEARFMNGCCSSDYSNIMIVLIYDNRQDQRFPKICFFTCKDVKAGEELEFDYGYGENSKYECNCNGCKNRKK
ncbi:Oidioi.mRNA.OKI2018_I69.PAR.g10964.t1.cds [Oikopleura dioica]|uniref:Oidioi.mRNA.OKI2018_I69.PAR.g10964.t1.cds n=1 Tax=Oikopleura dioica TaxID=34765 RepID=A0ABN7RZQ4_OIKDI|nr:Oidioi.mRNA.OKI2018_I69.PAR.g10964.t1.cds [Oikopleura dioica]